MRPLRRHLQEQHPAEETLVSEGLRVFGVQEAVPGRVESQRSQEDPRQGAAVEEHHRRARLPEEDEASAERRVQIAEKNKQCQMQDLRQSVFVRAELERTHEDPPGVHLRDLFVVVCLATGAGEARQGELRQVAAS